MVGIGSHEVLLGVELEGFVVAGLAGLRLTVPRAPRRVQLFAIFVLDLDDDDDGEDEDDERHNDAGQNAQERRELQWHRRLCPRRTLVGEAEQKTQLTNLKLGDFGGEDVHHHGGTGPVAVDGLDDQIDLLTRRQTRHRELRRQAGDVGQGTHGEAVQDLQQEDLLQAAVKARDAGDLQQLDGLESGQY